MKNKNKIKNLTIVIVCILYYVLMLVSAQTSDKEFKGELEIIHADDFEHPENSKYFFYLVVNNKRYELKSEKELPIVLSGTLVKVIGTISNDKIIMDNSDEKSFQILAPPSYESQPKALKQLKEVKKEQKFDFKWIYVAIPYLLLLVILIIYFLLKKRK